MSRDWSRPCESGGRGAGAARLRRRGIADIRSTEVNDYIEDTSGGTFTAKDFRTWNATVLAAVVSPPPRGARRDRKGDATERRRARSIRYALPGEHAGGLPGLLHRPPCSAGSTGSPSEGCSSGFRRSADWPEIQRPIEEAVLDLMISVNRQPPIERVT